MGCLSGYQMVEFDSEATGELIQCICFRNKEVDNGVVAVATVALATTLPGAEHASRSGEHAARILPACALLAGNGAVMLVGNATSQVRSSKSD